MELKVIFYLFFITLAICFLPITTLLYGGGQAIAARLFTRRRVSMFIGSLGNERNSLHVKTGPFDVWICRKPITWFFGQCRYPQAGITPLKNTIILLTGMLMPVVLGLTLCWFVFSFDLHGAVKLIAVGYCGITVYDLFSNLKGQKAIPAGEYFLINNSRFGAGREYMTAFREIQADDTPKAPDAEAGYARRSIVEEMEEGNFEDALLLHEELASLSPLNASDYANAAVIKNYLGMHQQSLDDFNTALTLAPDDFVTRSHRAFLHTEMGAYADAIADADISLSHSPGYSAACSVRGLARIHMGDTDGGLNDINSAIKENPNDHLAYRALGIHHLQNGDKPIALHYLRKGYTLQPLPYLFNTLIAKAKE